METATETKTVADDTPTAKGKLVQYAVWGQKEGLAEATITRRIRLLRTIVNKGANLQDPESIKETIAKQQKLSVKTKEIAIETYTCFLKMQGKGWSPPKYKAINVPYGRLALTI